MATLHHALSTRLIHVGAHPRDHQGAVTTPIYQSSTYLSSDEAATASYKDIRYIRLNNSPNHLALHAKIASIEGAQAALSFSSGMAAIFSTLFALLNPGDHVLASRYLYGATLATLTQELARFGVAISFFDPCDPASWTEHLRPSTRLVWVEAIANPTLEVPCLVELAHFVRRHELISVIDNTFCSPVNFRPIEYGFSLSLHSATKYLNGHSDVAAGCVSGASSLIDEIALRATRYGACLDPHAAFLLERGMKTLVLRVQHQNQSAMTLATALAARRDVEAVYYPGLAQRPDHGRASQLFSGFGGVLSFEVAGGEARARRVVERLQLATFAPSLGGPETLITLPARTSHASISAEQRQALGISDHLLRLSVGLEDAQDLLADLDQALRLA